MSVTLNDISIVIMSVWRDPEYIHKTLASLFISDPLVHQLKSVHIVVGGADVDYLNQYKHHGCIKIHSLQVEESTQISNWIVRRKFCHNYHRCLTLPNINSFGLCICEDDIMFQDRFIEKILAAINEMENIHKFDKYILDFYLPISLSPDPTFNPGRLCTKYNPHSFYGTQCVFYPSKIIPELAKYIYDNGVVEYKKPGDLLIAQFASNTNTLFGTKRSLVQHIGFHSTGLASLFHQSLFFNEFEPSFNAPLNNQEEILINRRFNFRKSIGEVMKPLGSIAQKKGIELVLDVSSAIPEYVSGDLLSLRQILQILIENALVFTYKGEIFVKIDLVSKKKSNILLNFIISDTGLGNQKIFCDDLNKPQQNPDDIRAHQLMIKCVELVDNMGGEIWVGEENDCGPLYEKGSTFQVTIPLYIKNLDRYQKFLSINELSDLPVLIIDDNYSNCNMLLNMLKAWGMKPVSVGCGEEALRLLSKKGVTDKSFWLILLDAVMPGMDGFEFAKQIGNNPNLKKKTLMMLSADIKGDGVSLCQEAGIYNHINKPIIYSELLEALFYFVNNIWIKKFC